MVRSEICKILAILVATYNNFTSDVTKENIWLDMLEDISYPIAQLAVKKYILTGVFPPTIADIRKIVAEISNPNINDGATAWGEVKRAISTIGYKQYDSNPGELFLKELSPLTQKVVKAIGIRELCMSENDGVTRGQFLKMYEQIQNTQKQQNLLPESLKNQIQMLSNNFDIKRIGDAS